MKALTQRGVETARPKIKRYGRPDGLVPGLQLIIHPSGAKTFALFARVHGRLINHRIGSATVLTLAEAREEARLKLTQVARGEDPRTARQEAKRAAAETVETVGRRFVERHAKPNNRRWRETERQIEREIIPRLGKRPVTSVSKRDIVVMVDAITDRGAPIMANRVLSTTRRLFNWMVARDLLEVSPCDGLKPSGPEPERDRVHTDTELGLIWRASDTLGYPFGPCIKLLILTGARRQEIAGLRWSELSPDLTVWTLPKLRAKNNVEHQVPLAPWARDIIAGLPRIAGRELVFSTTGSTPISGFARAKRNLDAEVAHLNGGPIPPWVVHDFRRSIASGMARLGVQLPVVERILGHAGSSFSGVAGIYQKFDFAGEKQQALEVWAAHSAAVLTMIGPAYAQPGFPAHLAKSFRLIVKNGRSPAEALVILTMTLQNQDIETMPALPDGWRLTLVDGELKVEAMDGATRSASEYVFQPKLRVLSRFRQARPTPAADAVINDIEHSLNAPLTQAARDALAAPKPRSNRGRKEYDIWQPMFDHLDALVNQRRRAFASFTEAADYGLEFLQDFAKQRRKAGQGTAVPTAKTIQEKISDRRPDLVVG